MWKLLLTLIGACTAVEAVLTSFDPLIQEIFLKQFRQHLLEKVAAGFNATMEQSYLLEDKTKDCTGKVEWQVEGCKSETKRKCGQFPSFLNELMKLVDLLINPLPFLKKSLNGIGDGIKNLEKLVSDAGKHFISSMKGLVGSGPKAVSDVFKGLQHGLDQVNKVVGSVLGNIANGLGSVGSSISNGLNKVGAGAQGVANKVGQVVGNIGNSISKIGSGIGNVISRTRFSGWKKRRSLRKWEVDADVVETRSKDRKCMQMCSSCHPLLLDQDKMVQSICGNEVMDMTKQIQARAQLLSTLYNATIDEVNPIISKIEYETDSFVNMKFTTVFVTAYIRGRYERYQSNVAYAFTDLNGTSRAIALEYWNKMV